MSVLAVARTIAVLSCGTTAGILFGDRMGASFARPTLNPSSFLQFQRIQHTYFKRMMPPLLIAAIVTALVWLFGMGERSGVPFWLVALATGAMIVGTALTRAVNIPINNQLMTWNLEAPPDNMREIWKRWERVHTIRTILWLCAFTLEAVTFGIFG